MSEEEKPNDTKDSHAAKQKTNNDKTYKKWLSNQEAQKRLKDMIQHAGTPLELRSKQIFRKLGYQARNYRYSDLEDDEKRVWKFPQPMGKLRELDIRAYKTFKMCKIKSCEVAITLNILCECKFSSSNDLFVFEHSDKANVDFSNFPIRVNGNRIFEPYIDIDFAKPIISEKIVEVDVGNMDKISKNYNDDKIHEAAEQLLSAIKSFYDSSRQIVRGDYSTMRKNSDLYAKWKEKLIKDKPEYISERGGLIQRIPDGEIKLFLMSEIWPSTKFNEFPYLNIHFIIPLIITDEKRGIIKVTVDDNYNITGFEDIGKCIYPYISDNYDKYQSCMNNHLTMPILICNLDNLEIVVKNIEDWLILEMEKHKKILEDDPNLIPYEIIFSDEF